MNSLCFFGMVSKKPELQLTKNGKKVLVFSAANNYGFGEDKKVNWFQCSVWGARAESLFQILHKGMNFVASGQLKLEEAKDSKGVMRLFANVIIADIRITDRIEKPAAGSAPPSAAPAQGIDQNEVIDDIPF